MNALLKPFGSWEMPISFSTILEEAQWTRTNTTIFDTSHMGLLTFKGDSEKSGLNKVFTVDTSKIQIGKCRYSMLLNEDGTIADDLIIYRIKNDEFLIVVNSETIESDYNIIKARLSHSELENISGKIGKIDLQGPLSQKVAQSVFDTNLSSLPFFGFLRTLYQGEEVMISRTGYTGELGYEIYASVDLIVKIWDKLLKNEFVKPAGMGARDILRLEMGYCLYGSDISNDTTAKEADLLKFCTNQENYCGKTNTETTGEKRRIFFKTNSRRSPRAGYSIIMNSGKVGFVTSGIFSPTLSCGIGMGFVGTKTEVKTDSDITISDGKVSIDAKIASAPFINKKI